MRARPTAVGVRRDLAICPRCHTEGDYICGWFSCNACDFEADFAAFEDEVAQQTAAFFESLPGLAPGSAESQLRELTETLTGAGIRPKLTWPLVVLWNERRARPPMATAMLRQMVTDVIVRASRGAAA